MHEITLKVPDQKLHFFLELVKNLGFEVADENEIPEYQKELVRERIKNSKAENLISWEVARKQLSIPGKT